MKILAAVLSVVLLFCSCSNKKEKEDFRGMWITHYTLYSAKDDFKENFTLMADNLKELSINNVFIQVRPFSDSAYPSKIFPLWKWAKDLDFDILSFMTEICHQRGIALHAWINPYRVSSQKDINKLPEDSPAKEELLGESDEGLYFDPAKKEVRELIIEGVKELLSYNIDGIHIDDYFYPTASAEFDKESYEEYLSIAENPLSLSDFRRQNVTELIKAIHNLTSKEGKIFSVSPAADIEKNENRLFASVKEWCNKGYVDLVIPQLYFGFSYPDTAFAFENLLSDWQEYLYDSKGELVIGLAPYKINSNSIFDREEWEKGEDIVARQIDLIRKKNIKGFCLFSYSSVFGNSKRENSQYIKIKEKINELKNK